VHCAGLVLIVVAGCSGDEGPYAHLADRAAEVRQLTFFNDVPYETLTPEQFRDQVAQDVDEATDAELREYADTYGRLGFFDVELDLRPIFVQSRVDATGAFYSPADRRITFVGEPEDSTVIHEYVHALQDQHFHLREYDDGARSTDWFYARRAVVEGDATLAEARFRIEEQGATLDRIDYFKYFEGWTEFSEKYLDDSSYPLIFRAYTSFVYAYGLIYSATNLFGVSPTRSQPPPPPHSWGKQNDLFRERAPYATLQILGSSNLPVSVGIGAVPAALSADLERIDSDTLGAWYVYLLFRPIVVNAPIVVDAQALRLAWIGDQALFVRHTTTGAMGVLWASAWSSVLDAAAAETALRALHGATTEPLVIERRGNQVVLARNIAADLAPVLVEAAFTGAQAARRSRPPLHVREAIRHLDRGAHMRRLTTSSRPARLR
jgi:hypothetical protein